MTLDEYLNSRPDYSWVCNLLDLDETIEYEGLTPGLEAYLTYDTTYSLEEAENKAASGMQGVIQKITSWIKGMSEKVMNMFRSNTEKLNNTKAIDNNARVPNFGEMQRGIDDLNQFKEPISQMEEGTQQMIQDGAKTADKKGVIQGFKERIGSLIENIKTRLFGDRQKGIREPQADHLTTGSATKEAPPPKEGGPKKALLSLWDGFVNVCRSLWEDLTKFVKAIPSYAKGMVTHPLKTTGQVGKNAIGMVDKYVGGAWQQAKTMSKGKVLLGVAVSMGGFIAVDWGVEHLFSLLNKAISKVSDLLERATDAICRS